jgi:polyhydroxyalkanoate synthesis regulator phasin
MVVTEVRKYMEAAVEKLSPAKAQEMARSLLQGQAKGREQVQKVAQDLMDWSNETRGRMREMIRREVTRQLKAMGVASKDEVEALKARVRALERSGSRAAGASGAAKKTSAARAAATKSRARTTSAKTSGKTSAPRRSAGPSDPAGTSDGAGS